MRPFNPNDEGYLEQLEGIAEADVAKLKKAQESYGNSWKKRGGANAFFMLCRKWDRIEKQVEKFHHDIFGAAENDTRPEGIIDDIKDLRQYLMLVEADLKSRQQPGIRTTYPTVRDVIQSGIERHGVVGSRKPFPPQLSDITAVEEVGSEEIKPPLSLDEFKKRAEDDGVQYDGKDEIWCHDVASNDLYFWGIRLEGVVEERFRQCFDHRWNFLENDFKKMLNKERNSIIRDHFLFETSQPYLSNSIIHYMGWEA